jgi:hypothetical protein
MASDTRQRKTWRRLGLAGGCLVAVLAMKAPWGAVYAATTERVVVDWHSGLAISGFDPVAYFTDGSARLGRADLEASSAGAVWRFVNEGNRAAFVADPEVYMPQFGGYDPIAIARGVSTAGHPQIWVLSGKRLFLFYSVEARQDFMLDPETALLAAEQRWPEVVRTLTP